MLRRAGVLQQPSFGAIGSYVHNLGSHAALVAGSVALALPADAAGKLQRLCNQVGQTQMC